MGQRKDRSDRPRDCHGRTMGPYRGTARNAAIAIFRGSLVSLERCAPLSPEQAAGRSLSVDFQFARREPGYVTKATVSIRSLESTRTLLGPASKGGQPGLA